MFARFTEKNKTLLYTAIFGGFIIAIIGTQLYYDDNSKPFTHKFEAVNRVLLPPEILPYINFGFRGILADVYWLRSVQDLIQWNLTDHFYVEYFRNISVLDQKFEYPYLFGIFVVPNEKSPTYIDEIAAIADKGIEALPKNWKIPFYLSTKYKSETREFERANHYLEIAIAKDDTPSVVKTVYTAFKKNQLQDKRDVSLMIKVIYDTTDNETIKKLAARGIIISDLTTTIEKGIARFKVRYNMYPKNLAELEAAKSVRIPQEIKNAFDVQISPNGGFKIMEKKQ